MYSSAANLKVSCISFSQIRYLIIRISEYDNSVDANTLGALDLRSWSPKLFLSDMMTKINTLKSTDWMSNSPVIWNEVARRCDETDDHHVHSPFLESEILRCNMISICQILSILKDFRDQLSMSKCDFVKKLSRVRCPHRRGVSVDWIEQQYFNDFFSKRAWNWTRRIYIVYAEKRSSSSTSLTYGSIREMTQIKDDKPSWTWEVYSWNRRQFV